MQSERPARVFPWGRIYRRFWAVRAPLGKCERGVRFPNLVCRFENYAFHYGFIKPLKETTRLTVVLCKTNVTLAFSHGAGRTTASGQLGPPRESASVVLVFQALFVVFENYAFHRGFIAQLPKTTYFKMVL